ncbi:Uncharacterised protein [Vibrio cholerae]|nr:Uncharacterised protein [Vibrio cholerae]
MTICGLRLHCKTWCMIWIGVIKFRANSRCTDSIERRANKQN